MCKLSAQNQTFDETNLQLRELFSPLLKPTPTKKFLYEMAMHSTDSSWYVTNCADTNVTDLWYKVYEEMYHSAYDTAILTTVSNIYNAANNYSYDTIPLGIINYDYYSLKHDALTTNNYFNFDTVNTVLTNITPRPSWPYTENNTIFMCAPLIESAQSANPVFTINPQFFYLDNFNASNFSKNSVLKIGFGDGTGWHSYDPTITSYYQPNYSLTSTIEPIIRVQLTNPTTLNIFGSTLSRFFPGGVANVPPDEDIILPGLQVGLYNSCANSGKTVIYLEGIDPLDFIPSQNRTTADIYREMIQNNRIVEMRNQGYRFAVVSWRNSRIDMRLNALHVVNLIQVLKQQHGDNEQFVVIGESMGGVIARYALTYMESPDYFRQNTAPFFVEQNELSNAAYLAANPGTFNLPTNWALPEKMHNTRLFISMDAPHQGANVPLAIQKAYKNVMRAFGPYIGIAFQTATTAFNLFLDGKAAKQLLIEHVNTESGSGFYKTYTSTNARNTFMAQLNGMGGYPQFAKIMLMSNGALNGTNQVNPYSQQLRSANDRLIEFKVNLYGKVLGIKVPFYGGSIGAFTNPAGNGKILQANAGRYKIKIKLKWFGVKVSARYNSLFDIADYANTKPYCTSAGSTIGPGTTGLIGTEPSNVGFNLSNNYWLLNLFSVRHIVDGQGCSIFKMHQGFNGFLSTNLNISLCTDGLQFGFIPTYSALDYNANGALNTNIERANINIKLANVPARVDVLVGIHSTLAQFPNLAHLNFRNDGIFNLTNTAPAIPNPFNTYFSCINNAPQDLPRVRRGFLNLEIGDEELYLENNTLQYNGQYKVEYDLHVNERNPRYEYPIQPFILNTGMLVGIYSRQNIFAIAPTGFARFVYDDTNGPAGHIGFYGNTTGNFIQVDEPLNNCCVRFSTLFRGSNVENLKPKIIIPTVDDYLKLSPNPLGNNQLLRLDYKFKKVGNIILSIINLQGVQVYNRILFVPTSKINIVSVLDVENLQLPQGMYIVKLSNGNKILTSKLVISK